MCHNLLSIRDRRSERRTRGGNSQLPPLGERRSGTDRCRLTPAMYCPLCGAEYRSGFTTCSDCQVTLVPDPPAESSDSASTDTTSFALIWSGGDPRKHAEICEALERREIPARTLRREDHLFNPTAHAPFEVYIPVDLMTTAREAINEAEPSEDYSEEIPESDSLEIPDADSPPDHDADEGYDDGRRDPRNLDPEDATDEVWSGDDPDLADMIKSSLRENHILCRSDSGTPEPNNESDEMRAIRLLVFPEDKDRARAIVQQILDAAPPG